MTSPAVDQFRQFVYATFGIQHDESKLDILSDVMRERQRANGLASESEYLQLLHHSLEEQEAVARRITVSETYFFRVPEQFDALIHTVLPERVHAAQDRPIRILSCGCASGEEPYTIAMLLAENKGLFSGARFEIHAVDLNPAVLELAVRGTYTQWSMRATKDYYRNKYFEQQKGRTYQLRRDIREAVTFRQHNLFQSPLHSEFDVILFRNVLIYFSPQTARRAIANVEQMTSAGGYLFLGPAETLRGLSECFEVLHTDGAFYYRVCRSGAEPAQPRAVSTQARKRPAVQDHVAASMDTEWFNDIHRSTTRIQALFQSRQGAPDATPFLSPAQSSFVPDKVDEEDLTLSAVLHLNHGEVEKAEHACQILLERNSMDAVAHYLMALCREQRGDLSGAIDQDEIACYLDPTFAMPQLHKGMLACRSGQSELGRRSLQKSLELLRTEDSTRILLLGGGFHRHSLMTMCERELAKCGGQP